MAYWKGYSKETVLLKVKMGFLDAIDIRKVVCLVLLGLITTFDMVNHSLQLNMLKYRFRVDGTVLNWLHNYLTDRSQKVVIDTDQGHAELDPITLSHGVPQGLVLGPILFTLYMLPLSGICRKHNIEYHGYDNDQQEYLSFIPTETSNKKQCTENLEKCIDGIWIWMRTNLLKLNGSKTEFMMLGTKRNLEKVKACTTSIKIGNDEINNVMSVRDLGFCLDNKLKSDMYANKLTSALIITPKG